MQPRPSRVMLALLMLLACQQEPAAAIPEDVRTQAGLELDHGYRGFLAEVAEIAPLDPQLEAPAAGAVRLLAEPGREPVNRIVLVDGDGDGEEIGKQGAGAPRDLPKHRHPRAGGHEDQGSKRSVHHRSLEVGATSLPLLLPRMINAPLFAWDAIDDRVTRRRGTRS